MTDYQQLRGTTLVAISSIFYGMMSYFGVHLLQDHLSVLTMLFWRFFAGALCMLPLLFQKSKQAYPALSWARWTKMTLFGAVVYSASSGFYFTAAKQVGTGLAMVLFFAYPIFVILFARLFSCWRFNKHTLFAMLAVLIGLIFLKGNGHHTLSMVGIICGLIAALFYAIYVYGSQHTAKAIDSRVLTFCICLGNASIFFVMAKITHAFSWPSNAHAWLNVLILGLIGTALPIQLLLDGLKYIDPIKASILSVLEPVMTLLIGLALLHETVSVIQAVGVVVVLTSAILIQFERVQEANE